MLTNMHAGMHTHIHINTHACTHACTQTYTPVGSPARDDAGGRNNRPTPQRAQPWKVGNNMTAILAAKLTGNLAELWHVYNTD